ncbi:50S ribosomal protein L23 [Thiomicrorhabdus lithotrophica]|uniref:Large ribosomal subunit protein uL23 n=1 Tax=Thiomicrorhabdus lithotrophica TaxID=2949997 RepID=A0ABY8CDY2_9GAMM|nr:50S ribosomal protein L23 [Thiomicrorhabdus lithotrophica]MEA1988555.1 50S ribosomal protein L23 [Pseudomonadota bacterium]WEJ63007.1 50S ribosomal protein L23 [Thiomicrorhabdus lithotrophica]
MNQERILQVLLAPHVSEKSALMADAAGQYVFKVVPSATKTEVKQAVESLFDVKVQSVNMINLKGKRKVFKGRQGQRNGIRKAIVRLAPGQDIDFASAE